MKENIHSLKWQCIGKSVQGASHKHSGLPNQDAIEWYPKSGIGSPLILAISDGHGSAKSFRSHKGSCLAVKTAIKVIQEFSLLSQDNQNSDVNLSNLENYKDAAERILPQRIVNEWIKAVNKDLDLPENCPIDKNFTEQVNFTDEEKHSLVQKDGEVAWQAVENNRLLAYGATLLAVLVTEFFIVYVQLGDGDILQVDSKGNTTRPLKRNPKLIANETTSLCMDKAWNEFQVYTELYPKDSPKEKPALILIATDGYSNSFSTDEGFFKIGQEYRQMFKSNLIEDIGEQLEDFLQETSEKGSGDDITLGIIKRLEKDDQDHLEYLEKRVTSVKKKVDSSMRQQEDISGIESKVNRLGKQPEIIHKKVSLLVLGFIVTFSFALISTALSSYFFFRLNRVEQSLEGLKQQPDQSQPANSTSKPAPHTPEAKPSPTPTPSPKSAKSQTSR